MKLHNVKSHIFYHHAFEILDSSDKCTAFLSFYLPFSFSPGFSFYFLLLRHPFDSSFFPLFFLFFSSSFPLHPSFLRILLISIFRVNLILMLQQRANDLKPKSSSEIFTRIVNPNFITMNILETMCLWNLSISRNIYTNSIIPYADLVQCLLLFGLARWRDDSRWSALCMIRLFFFSQFFHITSWHASFRSSKFV